MKQINRAQSRGKPLDEDCKTAVISKYLAGLKDPRIFCYGIDTEYDVAEKCRKCGAYVYNAEPWKGK